MAADLRRVLLRWSNPSQRPCASIMFSKRYARVRATPILRCTRFSRSRWPGICWILNGRLSLAREKEEPMDAELPTITASELMNRAASFARVLVSTLDTLDEQYPNAEMSPKEKETLKKLSISDFGPSPQQFTPVFERLFLTHMASRFVIVPD